MGNVDPAATSIRQGIKSDPLTVFGTRRQSRSLRYVSHSVRGVMVVASGEMEGPVNVGPTDERTVLGVAELIRMACSSTVCVAFESVAAGDPRVPRPDATCIQAAPGWWPVGIAGRTNRTNSGVVPLVF